MSDFLGAIVEHSFLRNALIAGALASIACGVIGTYVVTRRITLIAGSLAHSVLGGMGAAYYARVAYGWEWLHPLYGAMVAAILAAFIISVARIYAKEREDTVISALWAIGMAIGIMFIFRTPGYKTDLMTYLFGNIVMVDDQAVQLLIWLDILIVTGGLLFYNQLLAVCFDEEFAKLRGVNITFFYTFLLCLTALTIVTLIYVVGIVMVIALMTLPVSVAGRFSTKLWQMMVLAAILSTILTTTGLAISYGPDLPPGATTILLAGTVYVLVNLGAGPLRRAIVILIKRRQAAG
ncbi:MAG: iron chelate uptake ABC transporter family permease subunit [Candidatus Latescibacteria bacterium]|nr:iron chelate uptake ABC transporter family permease subunit [Candidatus Latescibacterota bacterium]NIM21793.1 iron chelate uptake ABC transporter family permease subunit [Candidatus Latescibacterota bacterium]NIM65931.1 iron chelate uptake ABC transporter family permease subunit [Candidatus Latescibacterota bacterium]NIO02676.1 iron chelate uptake ABC transporter family permease subunit [Candidatus Latescibacterota bacterium]NIO29657.1 iron chelate uptake ABC transporter family permease subu